MSTFRLLRHAVAIAVDEHAHVRRMHPHRSRSWSHTSPRGESKILHELRYFVALPFALPLLARRIWARGASEAGGRMIR